MIPMVVVTGESCAYCKKAKMLIGRALQKKPAFREIEIRYVDQKSPEAGIPSPSYTCLPCRRQTAV
mgnify:CR=1 FL=1